MAKTFTQKLIENEDLFRAMMRMPESVNSKLPRMRRKEMFSFMWEECNMDRVEAMNLVNRRELDLVREYENLEVPEWILRCEAQDMIAQYIYDRFKEEGLIT